MKRFINIFLVGPMGAGKSTIGKQLARDLKLEFFDADQEIEARTGADIAWIFDVEGEDGFRKRESMIIDEYSQKQGIVLATGGGAVLNASNRQRLAARGTVIYLHTTVDQLQRRTSRDKRRPLIKEDMTPEALHEMMQQRDPLYREVADLVVSTDGRTIRSVSSEVVRMMEQEHLC